MITETLDNTSYFFGVNIFCDGNGIMNVSADPAVITFLIFKILRYGKNSVIGLHILES